MKIQINKVSKKLKNLREGRKLTQEELAHHLGISRQSIIALERGKCLPSLPLAIAFTDLFETTFEGIFCDGENIINHNFGLEVKKAMSNDLLPWSPMREAGHLHEAIDRLFESTDNWPATKMSTLPMINVYEKGKSIIIEADVPGIKEEDLSIEVGEDTLNITGEKKSDTKISEENYYRHETSFGAFSRTVQLPAVVDKEKAVAELKDGQLIITLVKKAAIAPKVTKIKVKKIKSE